MVDGADQGGQDARDSGTPYDLSGLTVSRSAVKMKRYLTAVSRSNTCYVPMDDADPSKMFRTLRGFLNGEEPDEANYFHFSVTLRIHGEGIPFEEISDRLGVEPTHLHRKGERRGPRSPAWKDDAWHFGPALPSTETLERHIEALWQIVFWFSVKWNYRFQVSEVERDGNVRIFRLGVESEGG
jgi:hypothetical protein